MSCSHQQKYLFDSLGELDPDRVFAKVVPSLPRLRGAVREIFQDLVRRRSEDPAFRRMSEGQSAWWLWTQIHHFAKDDFHGDATLEYRRVKQQDYVVACESVIVVYKKLKRRTDRTGRSVLVPANYRTRQNIDLWGQRAIDGIPDLPRVVFGYELVEELTEIKCYLGLPKGSNSLLRWHREIENLEFDDEQADPVFESKPIPDLGFEIEEVQESKTAEA